SVPCRRSILLTIPITAFSAGTDPATRIITSTSATKSSGPWWCAWTTYYLNGHHYIAGELQRRGIGFRKDDNAFLWRSEGKQLPAAADRLSPDIIRKRLDYWTLVLGPKFSQKDRAAIPLRREYSLNQVEYCRNFLFRRHFPIHKIFERSCELGLF